MSELKTIDECRVNLTDIVKYRKENTKKIKSFLQIIEKDIKNIKRNSNLSSYNKEIKEENDIAYENMKNLTGCKSFAEALAYFEECEKWLALYYMKTDDGKTPDRRLDIIEDLLFTYDMMAHATLNYYLYEKKEPIAWYDFDFYTKKDVSCPYVLTYVNKCAKNISDMIDAVDKEDNTRVYETYLNILNTKMVNPETEPFAEFL